MMRIGVMAIRVTMPISERIVKQYNRFIFVQKHAEDKKLNKRKERTGKHPMIADSPQKKENNPTYVRTK
jgi:hypothetical protein